MRTIDIGDLLPLYFQEIINEWKPPAISAG